uniref:U34-Deinotoxin-Dsu1bv_1 n=1 Tax=Deinopis subrufa TaxID=1905329 RepID=A0A4V2H9W2_DEISU
MKLLLTILVICAVLVIANAELEEFSENAPAPYGPEAVEDRACGNYKDKMWQLWQLERMLQQMEVFVLQHRSFPEDMRLRI